MSQRTPLTGILIGLSQKEVIAAKDHVDSSQVFERCRNFLSYRESLCCDTFTLMRQGDGWVLKPFCALCKKLTDFMGEEKK